MVEAFRRITYYVSIGISPVSQRCGICISTTSPQEVFHPQNDRKHVIHTTFQFNAAKKAPFSTIITALKESKIYPDDDEKSFIPQYNPDNHHYTNLNLSHLSTIITLLRYIIHGLDVIYINGKFVTSHYEIITPVNEFTSRMKRESPKLRLDNPGVIIVAPGTATIHSFPRTESIRDF